MASSGTWGRPSSGASLTPQRLRFAPTNRAGRDSATGREPGVRGIRRPARWPLNPRLRGVRGGETCFPQQRGYRGLMCVSLSTPCPSCGGVCAKRRPFRPEPPRRARKTAEVCGAGAGRLEALWDRVRRGRASGAPAQIADLRGRADGDQVASRMPVLGGVIEDCERAVVSPAPRSWVGKRRHPRLSGLLYATIFGLKNITTKACSICFPKM